MNTQLLKGKVALVTGGSSGIGFGTAKRLKEEGTFVYITGRRREVLEQAAAKLGSGVKAVQADISNKDDMLRLVNIIKEDKGGLISSSPTLAEARLSRLRRQPKRTITAHSM